MLLFLKTTNIDNYNTSGVGLQNMFHSKKVTYRSPPQSASTGFEVTNNIYGDAESLEPSPSMGAMTNDTAGRS